MDPSLDFMLWRSCEYPLCCHPWLFFQMLQYHIYYCIYIRVMWYSHVWAVILACLKAFIEKYQWGIRETWAVLCSSIQPWASVQQGGRYTQTGYYRVMLKSSHNYTWVFHYLVRPTLQDKIRDISWRRCTLAESLTDSLALFRLIVIVLNGVWDRGWTR